MNRRSFLKRSLAVSAIGLLTNFAVLGANEHAVAASL